MANWTKLFKIAIKYQDILPDLLNLVETSVKSTEDGKIDKKERSKLMSEFWIIIKKLQKK
jgi:hypothetical protein|tara:strand:+ start:1597 stop:1776 length:180 start_codon:yes stop_codon:yes gene_type:complete